ncbi:MAG: DNA mismatch repair protein MutS, partial [Lachnospirales bacterium]
IRKQTLTNCERYITSELKDVETYILEAAEKAVELEYSIFRDMIEVSLNNAKRVLNAAKIVGEIDFLASLAEVSDRNNYVKPKVNTNGIIQIKEGRHPVVESIIGRDFIPNDTYLDLTSETIGIITGPNMAGKSTYMRQVALVVLMAQIGSFVPATSAYIGITDRIFTRVGASDNLATGQSTFMVEMSEVANILKNATRNSLIILDEVGRGTSTYDGMSIAWAVTEYLASKVCARTLFATHYHELTKMSDDYFNIVNYRVSVKEDGENIVFLRKIVEGSTDKSYGIHVAKLAGVPVAVVKRAENILSQIDVKDTNITGELSEFDTKEIQKEEDFKKIIASIKRIDINTMTPLDAMQFIAKIKSKIDD